MQTEPCPINLKNSKELRNDTDITMYTDFTQIPAVRNLFIVAYGIVMLFAVVGNALICCVVYLNRKRRPVLNFLLVNLAVADFLVGVFLLPVKGTQLIAPAEWGIFSDALCQAQEFLQAAVMCATVSTLVCLCVDTGSSFERLTLSRQGGTWKLVCGIWITSCCLASPLLAPSTAQLQTASSAYGTISRVICTVNLPEKVLMGFHTMFFLLLYVLPLIYVFLHLIRCRPEVSKRDATEQPGAKKEFISFLLFLILNTPYFLIHIITQYKNELSKEQENYFLTHLSIYLISYINSTINPLTYAFINKVFRHPSGLSSRPIYCNIFVEDRKVVNSGTGKAINEGRKTMIVHPRCQSPSDRESNASEEREGGRPSSSLEMLRPEDVVSHSTAACVLFNETQILRTKPRLSFSMMDCSKTLDSKSPDEVKRRASI